MDVTQYRTNASDITNHNLPAARSSISSSAMIAVQVGERGFFFLLPATNCCPNGRMNASTCPLGGVEFSLGDYCSNTRTSAWHGQDVGCSRAVAVGLGVAYQFNSVHSHK